MQLAEAFDSNLLIVTAYKDARKAFEEWPGIDKGELPEDPIDAMQVTLMRWQRERFGDQSDEHMALGMIEETGETTLAQDAYDALDGLGDTCVFASQLATNNRLAIGPIIHLAVEMLNALEPQSTTTATPILAAQSVIAQVVLKGAQKIRGLSGTNDDKYKIRLVGAIACCIAHAAIATSMKGVPPDQLDISDVFLTIGERVLQRGAGHDAVPSKVG